MKQYYPKFWIISYNEYIRAKNEASCITLPVSKSLLYVYNSLATTLRNLQNRSGPENPEPPLSYSSTVVSYGFASSDI